MRECRGVCSIAVCCVEGAKCACEGAGYGWRNCLALGRGMVQVQAISKISKGAMKLKLKKKKKKRLDKGVPAVVLLLAVLSHKRQEKWEETRRGCRARCREKERNKETNRRRRVGTRCAREDDPENQKRQRKRQRKTGEQKLRRHAAARRTELQPLPLLFLSILLQTRPGLTQRHADWLHKMSYSSQKKQAFFSCWPWRPVRELNGSGVGL